MLKANYEAEQAVVGNIMMNAAEAMPIVETIIAPDEFYVSEFKALYAACHELYKANKHIDVVTVLAIVGEEYKATVLTAANATPSANHCAEYARLVHERAQKIKAHSKIVELFEALDGDEDNTKCQEIATDALKCFDSGGEKNTVSAEAGFLNFCERQDHPKKYMRTGFSILNKFLFLDKGDFIIIGGRPSAGKTAFTLQMMLNISRNYNVVYFSLETKPEKIFDRLISNFGGVSFNRIKTNSISEPEWTTITGSFSEFQKLKFNIVQAAGMTTEQIKSKSIQLHADVIFIDYLTLIKSTGKGLYERATNISMDLHTIAQKDNIAIIALSQLNRDGKSAPDMTSLRDSGQQEQDADAIILLNYDDQNPTERELIIAKNKEGRIGRIKLDFNGDKQSFSAQETRYSEGSENG